MNEMTFWTWVMKGFAGLVNMIQALVRDNIPATKYVRSELEKVHAILERCILEMKVYDE